MNFARYLHENRGEVLDLRADPSGQSPLPVAPAPEAADVRSPARRRSTAADMAVFRPVRPAFAPSFRAQKLPYIEPAERR